MKNEKATEVGGYTIGLGTMQCSVVSLARDWGALMLKRW